MESRPKTEAGLEAIISPVSTEMIPWTGGRKLFAWWNAARGTRKFPARRDFSPLTMGSDLATMVLHDIGPEDAPDFRLRLVGTEIVRSMKADPTGLPLAALPGTAPLAVRYRWVMRTRQPYLCLDQPLAWADKDFLSYSTLVLPLGPTDDRVEMLIANLDMRPRG